MKKIIIGLVVLISIIGTYLYLMFQKLTYDYKMVSYNMGKVDLLNQNATVTIVLDIIINSPLFFNIPINYLYYEIYFKDNLLGKSNHATNFIIKKKPGVTTITESVDIILDKTNIEVATNYIKKIPTEYKVSIIVNLFGINLRLNNIKFTY
jgi:hypothetical protein